MTGQQLRFYLVDVFAGAPLSGNPLSLVIDAEALGEQLRGKHTSYLRT